MSLHEKTIPLIILLLVAIIASIVLFVAYISPLKNKTIENQETTAERLRRESQPGIPISISPEDQKRLDEESKPRESL